MSLKNDRKLLRRAVDLLSDEAKVCWDSNVNPTVGKIEDKAEAQRHQDLIGTANKLNRLRKRLK